MIDVTNIDEILSLKKCGDLFSNDRTKAKDEYRRLSRVYHPDVNRNRNSDKAMSKINELYTIAETLFNLGRWEISNQLIIKSSNGKIYQEKYLWEDKFELGIIYVCKTKIFYVLENVNKKYFDNAVKRIRDLKYANDKMKIELSRYMPVLIDDFQSVDGNYVLVVSKTEDAYPLKLFLQFYKDKLEDRHSAWIVSRLCNIVCYLYYQRLSHNGISIQNCFVSPQFHTIMLYGGWWYCVEQDSKMIGTQKQIYDIMPVKTKTEKVGSVITDLECVKAVGRSLIKNVDTPKQFVNYVKSGSANDPIAEFNRWNQVLEKAYGERKFIKLVVSENQIYNN